MAKACRGVMGNELLPKKGKNSGRVWLWADCGVFFSRPLYYLYRGDCYHRPRHRSCNLEMLTLSEVML